MRIRRLRGRWDKPWRYDMQLTSGGLLLFGNARRCLEGLGTLHEAWLLVV